MTSDSNSEYHYFSSYKSSNPDKTIDVVLTKGSRQQKSDLKLFLVSYEYVHWSVRAEDETTLQEIGLVTMQRMNCLRFVFYRFFVRVLRLALQLLQLKLIYLRFL